MSSVSHTTTTQKSSFSPTVSATGLQSRPFAPPPPIQAKLTVAEPNDQYEQEADRVAETGEAQLQTMGDAGGTDDNNNGDESINKLQRKPLFGSLLQKTLIQSKEAEDQGEIALDAIESNINQKKGSGSALPDIFRSKVEQAIGADFSGVRVHTDQESDTLSRSLSARAFTTGNDIFFKQGEYNPSSTEGQKLITHELTHTIQQNGYVQPKNVDMALPLSTIQKKGIAQSSAYGQIVQRVKQEGEGTWKKAVPTEWQNQGESSEPKTPWKSAKPTAWQNEGEQSEPSTQNQGESSEPETPWKSAKPTEGKSNSFSGEKIGNKEQYQELSEASKWDQDIAEAQELVDRGDYSNLTDALTKGIKDKWTEEDVKKHLKYSLLQSRKGYEQEFSNSSHEVETSIKNSQNAVNDGKFKTLHDALKELYGWSDKDIEKYATNKDPKNIPRVASLNPMERKHYELHGGNPLQQNGEDDKLINFDTSLMFSKFSGKGFGIFVMTPSGQLYASAHRVGLFHHSSFLEGLPTACAGEIQVENGVVKAITNKSGHYRPTEKNMIQALDELKSRGVSLSGVKVKLIIPYEGRTDFDSAEELQRLVAEEPQRREEANKKSQMEGQENRSEIAKLGGLKALKDKFQLEPIEGYFDMFKLLSMPGKRTYLPQEDQIRILKLTPSDFLANPSNYCKLE